MADQISAASYFAAMRGDFAHSAFTPQDIVKQELQGQSAFVNSCQIPKEANSVTDQGWSELEKIGIIREEDVNELFCNATLPDGWTKEKTEHSMWSVIKDNRGLNRVSIFYKAAFYEQNAFFEVIKSRFSANSYHDKCDQTGIQFGIIDRGRNDLLVKLCAPVYYATLDDVLGVVCNRLFYSQTVGILWDARFDDEGIQSDLIKPMVSDEFYRRYHHVAERHDLISSAKKLAATEAYEWLQQIPNDLSQWDKDFDFPGIL